MIEKQGAVKYWCAYSLDLHVFHIGTLEVGLELATGQPNLMFYSIEEDLKRLVSGLKGNKYYQELLEIEEIKDARLVTSSI